MGVWAHPDDETFASAGIMAAAKNNGQEVICVTATKGEAGVQNESRWPASELGYIREGELGAVLDLLGVNRHHWFNYKDGNCRPYDSLAVSRLAKLMKQYEPDTVLTFGADGLTGHPDHQAIHTWVGAARQLCGYQPKVYGVVISRPQYQAALREIDNKINIFYNLTQPKLVATSDCGIYFKLTPKLQQLKCRALKLMPSQTSIMFDQFSDAKVCQAFSSESYILLSA